MSESATIARNLQLPLSQDYHFLRKEGIKLLQQLSGAVWTDYNAHDPGMTLLEQVCFAITDVSYRTNTDIRNLLFSNENEVRQISASNVLYRPDEIYPNGPITAADYRILIIDQIKNVNNVWVTKVKNHPLGIEGLYDVTVQVSSEVVSPDEYQHIKDQVFKLFAGYRNLSEDIHEIKILKPASIAIEATIDIQSDAGGEEVLGEVCYRLHQYFNPAIRFHTYEELVEMGMSLETIFNIPSFSSGFILPYQLHHKKSELFTTKITEIISTVPGVRNLSGMVVKKNGIRMHGNSFLMEEDEFASLDVSALSSLIVTKAGIPYDFDTSIARHLYEVKQDKDKSSYKIGAILSLEEKRNFFPLHEISNFASVQNTLPGIYGVGRYGLPDTSNQARKAKAKQLKAYLLQFDVILSNHLVQLQNMRNFFSIDELYSPTYFGKLPVEFPGLKQLLIESINDEGKAMSGEDALQTVLDRFDNYLDRKNQVLDHLLARFGERSLGDVTSQVKSVFGYYQVHESVRGHVMEVKANFLRDYKELSRYRARAFNYLEDAVDTQNIPTFKKRVCYKLNIKDARQRSLVHAYKNLDVTVRQLSRTEMETKSVTTPRGAILSYHELKDSTRITFLIKERQTLEYLLLYGANKSNYRILEADSGGFLVLFQGDRKTRPAQVFKAGTAAQAKLYLERLVNWFEKLSMDNEGFHVLEHILLRPYSQKQYHFDVLDGEGHVLLSSMQTDSFSKQKAFSEEVLTAGLKRSNYSRVQQKSGEHMVMLKYGKGQKMRSGDEYSSEEAAVHQITAMINYFKELQHEPRLYQERVNMKSVATEATPMSKGFYNHQLSIILPAWIPRFKNEEFMLIMGKSFQESLPAHLGVNFVWLGIEEMGVFESTQKAWLNLRRDDQVDWLALDALSKKLIDFLKLDDE